MTEFAKNAQKPCQAFFSKKHPKIEQISDDFKSNLLYAALPKGHGIQQANSYGRSPRRSRGRIIVV